MEQREKPAPKTGFAHLLAASGYSLAGLRRLAKESAFRQEVALILGLVLVVLGLGASLPEVLGLLALGALLVAVEALNTALEVIVDHLSPDWSHWAKDAKDLGSLAVAATLAATVLYAAIVVIW